MQVYLDSSMIVKRYIQEEGTSFADFIYEQANQGYLTLTYNLLNIGEVLGVFDQYLNRKWITKDSFDVMIAKFIDEMLRLLRLDRLIIIPTHSTLQMEAWPFILENRLYIADALQLTSALYVNTRLFVSGDKELNTVAQKSNLEIYLPTKEKEIIQMIRKQR